MASTCPPEPMRKARIGVRIPEQIKREGMKKAIDLDLDFGEYIAQLIEKDTKENHEN